MSEEIPDDIILPLVYMLFRGRSGTPSSAFFAPIVLLGQKTSAGTATAGAKTLVPSKDDAIVLFGRGSQLARCCAAFFDAFPSGELYAIALADASGTAASVTITVTGPASADGTLFIRVGDEIVGEIAIATGDAQNDIASRIEGVIDANLDLIVTASTSTNVVTVTCRHAGTIGNQYPVTINALGQAGGEQLPAGVGIAISATHPTNGATDPTTASWIGGLADDPYSLIIPSLTTSGVLSALKTELERRWDVDGPVVYGHALGVVLDSYADLLTLGAARADKHLCIFGALESANMLTPACELAAALGGIIASAMKTSPGRPVQRKKITGSWGSVSSWFTRTQRAALARAGIATMYPAAGELYIESEVTTYTKNPASGAPDLSWQYINKPFLLMLWAQRVVARLDLQFSDFSLADDGNSVIAGQKVTTPKGIAGEVYAEYLLMCNEGLMQNPAKFKSTLTSARATSPSSRVNIGTRPQPIDQVRQIAITNEFEG